ncbi:hypothetical protein K9U39_11230 [Rhodoblastus acidophilus]|uniref:Uncharacterized protein n=1 Tax=Candidatus Rhodoblastus alkanivorans TaxID=2954117 RepID=A0ABS9Z984_9HYPH|nr:hypothetical protein [Candidatus Rhodoblastus alkanivorans]MCI4678892.1 hypothetical protein [Candidatus Rhodoblastus alkanivorans]MCI4684184.1 hypothetical protein [Candidatus Rhodoblastus alkanivorans]MDI4641505.1 hypothetical protein [Rhodoblastus acidophilus]
MIKGLMSMGDRANDLQDAFSRPNVLAGYVINVTWRQLQPQSVASLDTSVIDASLDKVRRYNHENPGHPLKVVLRVNGAVDAPEWVRTLDGGPVGIKLRVNRNRILEAPLFWTDSYRKAWRNLQARLAARYDPEPLIAQVSNTECAHQTDEPYVNPTDSDSIVALFKAGFTNDKFKACLRNSIQDYDAWKTTRVDFTQNPFETLSVKTDAQGVTTGVYGPLDNQITIAIMRAFRAALGARAIISNHNLAAPPFPVNRTLYAAMKALGGPMQFQTASAGALRPDGTTTGLLKDWDGTIRLGVELGASAIEIWPSVAFHGKPVNDGWNPPPVCRSEIDPHECDGKPVEQLLKWDTELEAVR